MADPQTNAYSAYAQIAQKLGNDLALLALGLSEAPSRPSTGASTNGPEADFVATQVPSASNPFSSALAAPRVVDGMVAIDASSVDGDITGLLGELEALGLENGSTWGNTLSGLMPVDLLYKAAGVANLNQARGVMAQTNVGLVDSQADASMGTDVLRGLEGLDGTGVSIGVLSDSFDTNGTQQAVDIASGDLPSGGVAVLADLLGGSDEGRAMLQLIHDVAPGSDLLFRTAFLGQADFANGIQELFTAGSDIIVDDIFYFAEPFFMDGVIAQSADLAVQNGAMYFTSAGNSADNSYESAFNDSGFTLSYANNLAVPVVGKLHDFDPGAGVDFTQQVTIPGFSTFSLGLQWDDPFSSVNAASGGAVSDYDILLTGNLPSSIFVNVSSSVIGGDPFEVTSITNNGAAAAVANFVITHVSGPATNQLKYVMFRTGGTTIDEFRTDSSTVVGHSNANSAISTGAAYYAQTPNFGVTPPLLESFSSVGNTPIYFDDLGNRLASPEMRQGVDLVAPDGVDNTFFGSDSDGTGFPNFFGTSAAAPNAAAMAALLMQGSPSATPGDIFTAMRETAIDMGPAGLDSLSGPGLVDALAAFSVLNAGIQLDGTPGPNRLIGTNQNDTLNGLGGNDILIGLGGADELNGGDDVDTADYSASPGGVTVLLDAGTGLGGDAEGDTLIGIERAIGSIHDDVLTGDSNANLLSGGGGDDIIDGNAGTDLLRGGPGSDTIRGGIGNDTLDGGADGDDLDGGPGMDELDYRGSPDPVQIDLGLGAASGGFAQNDTISGFEYILGSAFGDILNGDSGINRLVGLGGDDTMNGGPGDDLLRGGVGADDLDGGDGTADVVDYSDSNAGVSVDLGLNTASGAGSTADGDTIFGFERIYGSRHNDSLTGNDGDNILKGVTGDDTMNGGLGNDLLRGGRGIDNLFGGGDNDTLDGGRGGDLLDGGDGAGDVLDYRASAAAVTVNLALNTASGAGSDAAGDTISNFEAVFGSAFGDTLTGIDGGTTLLGFGGSDVLTGGNSSDLLRGHAGNDTMTGGLGNDTLDGMGGTDVAVIAGSVLDFSFVLGTLMTVTDTNPADGDQGTDQVDNVELLRFDDLDVTVLTNNAPLVLNQTTTRNEADGLMTIDLRTQVRDLDGDALSFSGITLGRDSALIPFGTPADGVISIDPATLGLNLGDDLTVNFQYQVTDDSGSLANNSAMGSFDLHIIGADDPLPDPPEANVAPVATPVTLSANEVDGDVSILLDTFVSDPNTGDVLTITDLTTDFYSGVPTSITMPFSSGSTTEPGAALTFATAGFGLDTGDVQLINLTYTVEDALGLTDTGSIALTLTGDTQNLPPVPTSTVLPLTVITDLVGTLTFEIDMNTLATDPESDPLMFTPGDFVIGNDEATGTPITIPYTYDAPTSVVTVTFADLGLTDGQSLPATLHYVVGDGTTSVNGSVGYIFEDPLDTPVAPQDTVHTFDFEGYSDAETSSIPVTELIPFRIDGVAAVIETDELATDPDRRIDPAGVLAGQTTPAGDNVLLTSSEVITTTTQPPSETPGVRPDPVTTTTIGDPFTLLAPDSTVGVSTVVSIFNTVPGVGSAFDPADYGFGTPFNVDSTSLGIASGTDVPVTLAVYRAEIVETPLGNGTSDYSAEAVLVDTFEFVRTAGTAPLLLDFNDPATFAAFDTTPGDLATVDVFDNIFAFTLSTPDNTPVLLDDLVLTQPADDLPI